MISGHAVGYSPPETPVSISSKIMVGSFTAPGNHRFNGQHDTGYLTPGCYGRNILQARHFYWQRTGKSQHPCHASPALAGSLSLRQSVHSACQEVLSGKPFAVPPLWQPGHGLLSIPPARRSTSSYNAAQRFRARAISSSEETIADIFALYPSGQCHQFIHRRNPVFLLQRVKSSSGGYSPPPGAPG